MKIALADSRLIEWWSQVTAEPTPTEVDIPWRLDTCCWGRILARSLAAANAADYGIVASSIAFAAFLSLLPVLGLVALVYSLAVPPEVVMGNISEVVGVLPGDAQGLVQRWLLHSLSRHDGAGLTLLVSGALTLFSGRRVGRSLMRGVNIASGIEQDRGPFATQAVALAIVLAGFALMLAALVSLSALAIMRHLAPSGLPGIKTMFTAVLWGSLTAGPAGALLLTYRYAPARQPIAWRWALPGVVVALLMWIGATLTFGFYVGSVASYDSTYGSLSAIVVLQLWLMMSAWIFLFGARVNAEAVKQTGR